MEYTSVMTITFEKDDLGFAVVKKEKTATQGTAILSLLHFIKNNGLVEGKDRIKEYYDDFSDKCEDYYTSCNGHKQNKFHYTAEYEEDEGTYSIEAYIIGK